MYKLVSKMLCSRMQATILSGQSCDQGAYRPGFSTEDHILSLILLAEGCREWRANLFLAYVDIEKAYDRICHEKLWNILKSQGVGDAYINMIQKLYHGQSANVRTDCVSRRFAIERCVKQGDPVSSLLFLALLEECFRNLKSKWAKANHRRS